MPTRRRVSKEGARRLRRILCVTMVLILLISLAVPAGAAGTPTLSISSGEVKAGESVTLTVSIKDNPGIAATKLYIYFDAESFDVDVENDIETSSSFASGGLITNSIEKAVENGQYDGENGKSGVVALWYSRRGTNNNKDGAVLTITLKAKKDIANGEHTVKVGCSSNETGNEKGERITLQSGTGTITVAGGSNDKKPADSSTNALDFKDISGHWAEKYINQSANLGLVEGYEGLYRPDDTMTRAEFVTILSRSVGEPEPKAKASFTDLKQDWYFKSVAWAEENKVVNGMGDGLFDPTGQVTREQLVTILHRMAGTPIGGEMLVSGIYDTKFVDSDRIGDWAKQAMYWSVYEEILCGENSEDIGTKLAPKNPANRAQIAVMMIRYLNK